MIDWLQAHPMTVVGLVLWAVGILWLMPGKQAGSTRPKIPGLLMTAAGVFAFCLSCGKPQTELADEVMFWVFAIGALLCGVLMITAKNPVYAALWFALATLATCGLFLLQSAPFLAAATVIVYAGAVIVTFLFVIMLAQQSGAAGYDQRSGQSLMTTISAFVLLGAVAMTLQQEKLEIGVPVVVAKAKGASDEVAPAQPNMSAMMQASGSGAPAGGPTPPPDAPEEKPAVPGNHLSSADPEHAVGDLKGLGRSLFSDYLFAVELAGTLLLVASIGAIALAPRREQGAL